MAQNFKRLALSSLILLLIACSTPKSNQFKLQSLANDGAIWVDDDSKTIKGLVNISFKNNVLVIIEGDGNAWINRYTPSSDPTPKRPLNFIEPSSLPPSWIYLGRPCQFNKDTDENICNSLLWTMDRFAEPTIQLYNDFLDSIKSQYGLSSFDLLGYSGGGTIAAILASQRSDVRTLTTLAGNLDVTLFNEHHKVSAMPSAINPKDLVEQLEKVPQRHVIGLEDDIVPVKIIESYRKSFVKDDCIKVETVETLEHNRGWKDYWHNKQFVPPTCN